MRYYMLYIISKYVKKNSMYANFKLLERKNCLKIGLYIYIYIMYTSVYGFIY